MNAFAKKYAGQHGRDENGKRHGAQQRERDGPGHGPEEPALNALQREDRHIGGDDDGNRIEDWTLHLMRGLANRFRGCFPGPGSAAIVQTAHVPDDVFDHDHCAVDHHAEIQRTQREKVRRNVAQIQPDRSKQQGERNGQRDDESGTNVQQETERE